MPTYTPLQSILLSSSTSSVSFANIDQTYTDLVLIINTRAATNASATIRFNEDSGTNYSYTVLDTDGTTVSSNRQTGTTAIQLIGWSIAMGSTTIPTTAITNINNYSNTKTFKSTLTRSNPFNASNVGGVDAFSGTWRNTAAITSLTISGNAFAAGSTFDLYGIGPDSRKANGGNIIASDGTYWYHAFTTSGLFVPTVSSLTADVLVVAGGGGGGSGDNANIGAGGGGAGGIIYQTGRSITSAVALTIGAGGGGAMWFSGNGVSGTKGVDSTFSGLTATGGGYGGTVPVAGGPGGSGGGAGGGLNALGGTASAGSGGGTGYAFAGGNNTGFTGAGGGGGGAGGNGANAAANTGGAGGAANATWSSWLSVVNLGVSGFIAGGGGGAGYSGTGNGAAGGGGATAGSSGGVSASNATANTGSGGGGASGTTLRKGGNGGSGLVIVRYSV